MLIVLFCGSGCNSTSSAQTQLATSSINSARAPELSSEGQIWLRAAISSGSFPDLRWPDLSDYSPHVKKFYEHNRKAVRLSARRTPRHTRSKILVPERYRGSYLQHRKGFGNSPRLCPMDLGTNSTAGANTGWNFPWTPASVLSTVPNTGPQCDSEHHAAKEDGARHTCERGSMCLQVVKARLLEAASVSHRHVCTITARFSACAYNKNRAQGST